MSDSEVLPRRRATLPWGALLLAVVWTWTIWACAEHWRGNPNYSYGWAVPLLAFCFAFRRYLLLPEDWLRPVSHSEIGVGASALACLGLGLAIFALEYGRVEMWHPEIVLWTICILAIVLTLGLFWWWGGAALARSEIFPLFFFLTGVPWPPRIEQPLTSYLMIIVASATTEILHWLGIAAQSSGGAIALRSGLVGITEACSGIRSLQAATMFGLAMGEWFLLRPGRRLILLGIAMVLALITNLIRTLALALQAERHGPESVGDVHDLVGNVVITVLILAIWITGKLLSRKGSDKSGLPNEWPKRVRRACGNLAAPSPALFGAAGFALVCGIIGARLFYAHGEAQAYSQTTPYFYAVRDQAGNHVLPVPNEVWNELRPSSGEYVRRESPNGGDCFHFFWKPSVWNRFALVHRPDICMPGIGWSAAGAPQPIDIDFGGDKVRFYLFHFRRGDVHALELWGAWRNGDPVPLDYTPNQIFGVAPPPESLHLGGKRRSATEIVACSATAQGAEPAPEIAVALLRSVFQYKNNE